MTDPHCNFSLERTTRFEARDPHRGKDMIDQPAQPTPGQAATRKGASPSGSPHDDSTSDVRSGVRLARHLPASAAALLVERRRT
jgi:hypothetical protein